MWCTCVCVVVIAIVVIIDAAAVFCDRHVLMLKKQLSTENIISSAANQMMALL
jgi:hypothetical protein